jgi:UDP-3-O-[3-hydroxymyristoyl] glucosamine N-acyltransferase
MKQKYKLRDIQPYLDGEVTVLGNEAILEFNKVTSPQHAQGDALIWIKDCGDEALKTIRATKAKAIICHKDIKLTKSDLAKKCFLQTAEPKLLFSKIVNALFLEREDSAIHPTAIIDKDAVIGRGSSIGAYCVIGKVKIGANCAVESNCRLYDKVHIADNVSIGANTVIGSAGFGFSRDRDSSLIRFPHLGGVRIEENVEIGANSSIDRGGLGDTVIEKGVKVSANVHIAHNVQIGRDTLIIGNSILCGSCKIGTRTWISASVCVKNGVRIGDDVTIGMGSVVTKDVPDKQTWVGNPAKELPVH